MARAIAALPAASLVSESAHDPVEPILPDGIPVNVGIEVDPESARITFDLRDNVDCVDCGLNQTEACCLAHVFTAVFNCLEDDVAAQRRRLPPGPGADAGGLRGGPAVLPS